MQLEPCTHHYTVAETLLVLRMFLSRVPPVAESEKAWCVVLPSALPAVWILPPCFYSYQSVFERMEVWVSADERGRISATEHFGDYLHDAHLFSDGSGIWFGGEWLNIIHPMTLLRIAKTRERRWAHCYGHRMEHRSERPITLPIRLEDWSSGDESDSV